MISSKTFRVSFSEQTHYTVTVQARSEDDAVQRASDLYDRNGPTELLGFELNTDFGGTDDWEAEEVTP